MFLPLKQWGMEESCHDSSVVRTSQHVCIQFSLWFIYLHAMFITDNHEFFWSCNKHGICLSILVEIDSPFVCFVNAWGLHPRNGFVLLVWDSCIGFVWRLMHWQFFVSQIATSLLKASSVGKLIIIFPIPVIFVNFLFFNAAPHLRSFLWSLSCYRIPQIAVSDIKYLVYFVFKLSHQGVVTRLLHLNCFLFNNFICIAVIAPGPHVTALFQCNGVQSRSRVTTPFSANVCAMPVSFYFVATWKRQSDIPQFAQLCDIQFVDWL